MRSRKVSLLWALTLIAAAVASAQELPSVDRVLSLQRGSSSERVPKGAASFILKGNCDASNTRESGPFQIWVSDPRITMSLNDGDLKTGFDGKQLWRLERGRASVILPGGPLTEALAIFDPARRLNWTQIYPRIRVLREQEIGRRSAFVLETEPGAPGTSRFFIDKENGDLLRAEILPGLTFDLSDFHNLSGWSVPFHIVETTPRGDVYAFQVTSGDAVKELDGALFAAP